MRKSDFIFSIEELKVYLRSKNLNLEKIKIPEASRTKKQKIHQNGQKLFPLLIPKFYADLINWYDKEDPLRKMVMIAPEESRIKKYEMTDPIGDGAHTKVPGLIHRYPNRVLLNLTNACAVHCRFCFRKNLLGKKSADLKKCMQYIKNNTQIWEVIFSGGDPFTLTDEFLRHVLKMLRKITHVRMIRFHTRTPVVYPKRITRKFTEVLKAAKPFSIVFHINHPKELSAELRKKVQQLKRTGAMLLSQTVFMKGVNNKSEILKELFEKLIEMGIRPYYLHHLDPAPGTHYFRISVEEGKRIMQQMRGNISGICMPQYVIDIPGGMGKIPVFWFSTKKNGIYKAKNYHGKEVAYKEQIY